MVNDMVNIKRNPGRPPGTKLNGRRRYMTEAELDRFMAQARKAGKKYALLFALVYYYAMRVEEAVTLLLSDFNLPSHQITIRGKKAGRVRTYDLPEQIEQKFQRWLKERADLEGASENPYVFPSSTLPRSGHLSRDAAQATFRTLAKRAEVGMPRSIHDLRHTAARLMIKGHEDLATVQGWLRHRDIESTKTYIDDRATEIVERRMAARNARFL
jgi:integrase/recombinase XerD